MGTVAAMSEHSIHHPLLNSSSEVSKAGVLVSLAKWILNALIWVIFIAWVALIFLYPTQFGNELFEKWTEATSGTLFGLTGSIFVLLSGPLLVIGFLSIAHLMISEEEGFQHHYKKSWKPPRVRLWTFPILVDGFLGVVSAAEFVGILLFVVYIVWAVYAYTLRNLSLISEWHLTARESSIWILELTGLRFGAIGLFCLAFLFLPIARGSVLLRFINIPFEHATRYHVWLGHLTMLLFTLHGLFYVIAWAMQGNLLHEILEWKDIGIANLAGVISLVAGLLMWVTSLHPIRRWNFELFFYTHQLYVVFVLFLALHVGDFIFSMAAGAIFLFVLDRFLRFCQSRRTVDIISAKCLPCGTVELVLSKPRNLRYNALSFIFLQVHGLSWLQWHPFSVSSSPLDGKYHLSILIKVLGKWTEQLRRNVISLSKSEEKDVPFQHHHKITASVEGPYGHEQPYHLMYENLILVAGGIGISPFLAILSDILHRVDEGRPCLPRNILVVWAIKKSNELPLLSTIDMESICPKFSDKLNLEILVYVTRQLDPSLEEGKVHKAENCSLCPLSKGCGMSVLVGTGDSAWSGIYVIVSTVGFIILLGLMDAFYINPFSIASWWYKGLLFLVCMVASVFIFGGAVICLWSQWERKTSAGDKYDQESGIQVEKRQRDEPGTIEDFTPKSHSNATTVRYGLRPDFKEIFGSIVKGWGYVDVGVIVCGPPTLQSGVAKEIRSHNLRREAHEPVLHFNSHSFDL